MQINVKKKLSEYISMFAGDDLAWDAHRISFFVADPARYRRGGRIHSALSTDNGIRLFPTFG